MWDCPCPRCLPRLLSSIYFWYLIAIQSIAGSLNRYCHPWDKVNLVAMIIKGSLHSPQNSGTPEPEPYHWLQFSVLPRNQQNQFHFSVIGVTEIVYEQIWQNGKTRIPQVVLIRTWIPTQVFPCPHIICLIVVKQEASSVLWQVLFFIPLGV